MSKTFTDKTPEKVGNLQGHLIKLPQELRDQIYDDVFTDAVVDIRAYGTRARHAGLTIACKQLYLETIELYYQRTAFVIGSDAAVLYKWLKKIPAKHGKLVQDVRFDRR
ncbi:hypothetical protein DOTSEDRAFT_27268 [Dothistroma septosporum NZE10]|uniref:Uncharacterized protein n=1 Tax=Dothistroma septosporum (strain NZE10 / CBS 128990) TaxID=675120 RepID=N1PH60_DOTSN|nr:hypothetical protein DOTSEDRAFT_27268 [Dothistroma septosporum NZE10]